MRRYNFRKAISKELAKYKLWVRYKPEHVNGSLPAVKVYYSHDKQDDPMFGYNKLLMMLFRRLEKVEIAILYDNQTHKELKRF